jgi:hypothetical protein
LRADGKSRSLVRRQIGIEVPLTTLIGMEWNALTYAGHTVWNVHAERDGNGYVGGSKRRPRDEWQICRDTHKALISEEQAEGLIEALENSKVGKAVSRAKAAGSPYLLTPLLETPEGRKWQGERRRYYRLKAENGKRGNMVPLDDLHEAVLDQVMTDAQSPEFVRELGREARKMARKKDPAKPLRQELAEIDRKISRAGELSLQLEDPTPMIRIINSLNGERKLVTRDIKELDKDAAVRDALANITDDQVATVLKEAADPKALLATVVDRITLDPDTLECQIHYRLPKWLCVASPRGNDSWPLVRRAVCFPS